MAIFNSYEGSLEDVLSCGKGENMSENLLEKNQSCANRPRIGIRHIWSSLMDVLEWNATNNAHAMYVHYSCDTGFFKKTAIHMKPQRYLAYPRNPQLQCCDRKCRASSTKNGCFFWRPPNTKFRRQHWIGGRGGHDLCGVVVNHGMAVFFEEPGMLWLAWLETLRTMSQRSWFYLAIGT